MKYIPVDPSLAYIDCDEDYLKALWKSWYPHQSGPLGASRQICALIESIAHLRGWDAKKWRE